MSNEFCAKCGAHWDEHEFGVPAPFCPRPMLDTPEARAVVKEQNAAMDEIIMNLKRRVKQIHSDENEIERLKSIIGVVHSWIVCAAITTPADMMQNAEWIERITNPEYTGDGVEPDQQIYE